MTGAGPAWPPVPDPVPTTPRWADGRALSAVWRDSLSLAVGGLSASEHLFPAMRPGTPWDPRPEAESDADVDQAIAAKVHLSLRMLPILAEAQLLVVEPTVANLLPLPSDIELVDWAAHVELPHSPLFVDFESVDGMPVAWEAETWPRPLHVRGALCWRDDVVGLCVIPFGSVGGLHPWGGTDYQPWIRWIFTTPREQQPWPPPGPGDFYTDASGDVGGFVDPEHESICAHQGAVALNLAQRALSVLMALDYLEVPLVERALPRPARRRAQRAGERIGLVPAGLPALAPDEEQQAESDQHAVVAPSEPCVVARSHARLNQAHLLWHEALDAYTDPDVFVTKLNALVQALRSVTFVLQKQLRRTDGFEDWYAGWQQQMRADGLMSWLVQARNEIEKQGDLAAHSIARVHIAGDWLPGPVTEMAVDPTTSAVDIARRLLLVGGLPDRVRREGVLVVERRWTVEELEGHELLDALAYCFSVLAAIVADAHKLVGAALERCELVDEDHHAVVLA